LISSLLFALLHVGQGPAPIPLFFLALVLGYLYHQTHRIWPGLIVHAGLNGLTAAMLWVMLEAK
jgi:membrane protease YdiL (CAAX protease family)